MSIYLDYNATAPVRPEVAELMLDALQAPRNPSSVHRFGREARKILEDARAKLAQVISVFPREIIFTASATEANHWALNAYPARRALVGAAEHASVLKARADAEIIPVDANGVTDLAALDAMLAKGREAVVSVMLANNETGVIQPVSEIKALCTRHKALFHCDAVQGLGKLRVDAGLIQADMLTLSGHKCGGPVGAAALVVRPDLALPAMYKGGGQELSRRAGTENVAAIAGFALAAEMVADLTHMQALKGWLAEMEAELVGLGANVAGVGAERLPNTSCILMPGTSQEVQLMHFDLAGIAVSAGAACTSGRIEASHVLIAMGFPPEEAGAAIRISGGWETVQSDLAAFASAWKTLYNRQRAA